MHDPKSSELLRRYLNGQDEAATAIFDRYLERLIALARARIGVKLRRRVDPEDIVQSAYRSFFVHARNQEYQLDRSGDLWRLLASTTLNKLYGEVERQTAAKRSIDREASETLAAQATRDPAVVDVVAIGEQLKLIMDGLRTDERDVLMSTLQGQSIEEISASIGKSKRTVRRLLAQSKQKFEQRLLRPKVRAAPARSLMAEPLAPLKFSDYVLEQLLGSGGMGKVYRAREKRTGKTVAVKALHKLRQSDERAVAQFVQESWVLAKLRHVNIVGVQGLGRFPAGGFFIVMDFVDGADLQSRLDRAPLPLRDAIPLMKQVAGAIQHAHDHGVVHCDLKPANVLVDNSNHVFVTDFGFAFILADASRTQVSCIGGTAGYIAPELLQLKSQPTPAADIFALGVLLWTLVTGTIPRDGDSLHAEHESLTPVKRICRRCLADEPTARYPLITDFLADLNELERE